MVVATAAAVPYDHERTAWSYILMLEWSERGLRIELGLGDIIGAICVGEQEHFRWCDRV